MEVAGIELNASCVEAPVNINDSDFLPEELIKLLTDNSGIDCQMLIRITFR